MSQFRSTGGLDDAIAADGDRGFFGVNQRLQLNQLQPGEVRESVNGRMEGFWKPRKNVQLVSPALTTGGNPLQLPFHILPAPHYLDISNVSYTDPVVTITTSTNHGLFVGVPGNIDVSDLTYTGNNPNGIRAVTATTATELTFSVAGAGTVGLGSTPRITQINVNDAAASEVLASCVFSDPNDSNKEYIIVALETLAKKIDLSATPMTATTLPYPVGATVGQNCDMIQCFDKVMLFRDGAQALEWYPHGRPVVSASQAGTTTVTMNVRDHGLTAGTSVVIEGLTGGTPPSGTFTVDAIVDKDQFTFIGPTSQTVTFDVTNGNMADGFTFSPGGPYSQPQTFNANGLNIEALDGLVTIYVENNLTINMGDTVLIYEVTIPEFTSLLNKSFQVTRATINEIEFYAPVPNYTTDVVSASQTGTTVTMVVRGNGFETGDSIEVTGLTGTDGGTMPNGTQTVTSVSGDQFTYTAAEALPYYTIPTPKAITAVSVAAGVVTITINSHGFGGNGWAEVSGLDSGLNGNKSLTRVNSNELSFAAPGVTSVTITSGLLSQMTYNLTTTSATALNLDRESEQIEVGGRFSVGGGFMHQPGAPWGAYFQRRIWVPYYYEVGGATLAPTYTSRKITDEIVASDILDTTTFDQIANQFRVSGGTADYVVAMHGFYNDVLIVFNRNSIHGIYGTQGSLADTVVKELTSEVGCLARKTVVMQANNLLFLSDNGVYGLTFADEYNLRGVEEPLSKNIQPYIDRINQDLADKSVAILYDNRYYIAVPLDSVPNGGDARGNNAVLVYNFLNKGWESVDTYGDSRFLIEDFVIATAGVRNDLYAIAANGGLHKMESSESSTDYLGVDNTSDSQSTAVDSYLVSRGYDFGTLERKRFTDAQVQMQALVNEQAEYDIDFAAEDPDSSVEIGSTTTFLGGTTLVANGANESETASIRCRLGGVRGYTGTMTLTRTVGSPKIHSIQVSGSITNRQILSQK
jgi:hypothetical protein